MVGKGFTITCFVAVVVHTSPDDVVHVTVYVVVAVGVTVILEPLIAPGFQT